MLIPGERHCRRCSERKIESFKVVGVEIRCDSELLVNPGAGDRPGGCARLVQRGQKHAGEDGDDGNYHEELYEGKSAGSAPDVWYETVPSVEFHNFRLSLVCVVSSLSFAGDEHVSGV